MTLDPTAKLVGADTDADAGAASLVPDATRVVELHYLQLLTTILTVLLLVVSEHEQKCGFLRMAYRPGL